MSLPKKLLTASVAQMVSSVRLLYDGIITIMQKS
jgi:hypothetical protein